jgi:hypothetical protein
VPAAAWFETPAYGGLLTMREPHPEEARSAVSKDEATGLAAADIFCE